jgi:hypothetical protein
MTGSIDLSLQGEELTTQTVSFQDAILDNDTTHRLSFIPQEGGLLTNAAIRLVTSQSSPSEESVTLTLSELPNVENPLTSASISGHIIGDQDHANLILEKPITVEEGETVYLKIAYTGAEEGIALKGTAIANEGHWDDGLPVRLDNYDGFAVSMSRLTLICTKTTIQINWPGSSTY